MQNTILTTKDLTKQFKETRAVNGVSMEIHRGDIYGFIGVNGAGKTTFMRMICGLFRPTEGNYSLFGADTEDEIQKARKRMGALIEHPAISPNMSAMENLEVQRRYLSVAPESCTRESMQELLELVGLGTVGKKRAGKFSMGMKQRLGLAIALIGNPEFLILDEPSVGLDPIGVVELRTLLLKLNKERNLTILFSSHNLSEMSLLATRYGFLHKGTLIKELTAQQLEQDCRDKNQNLEGYFMNLLASFH